MLNFLKTKKHFLGKFLLFAVFVFAGIVFFSSIFVSAQTNPYCPGNGILPGNQFWNAQGNGLISFSSIAKDIVNHTATVHISNQTGCEIPMSLVSYKMFDGMLSHQVLFDSTGLVNVTSSTDYKVSIPSCASQVDFYYGLGPTNLLDSNPYINANGSFVINYSSDSDSFSLCQASTPTPAPTVTLTANPTSIAYNGSSTLTWTSTNATSCSASGDWSGAKTTSGSETENNLTSNKNYVITCTGAGGTASATATVSVGSQSTNPYCPGDGILPGDKFWTAQGNGLISFSSIIRDETNHTATVHISNQTDCEIPMSLISYKMFDGMLSHQVLFDSTGLVNATSSTDYKVSIPSCASQVDFYYGLGPSTLLDSNPYINPNGSFIINYSINSDSLPVCQNPSPVDPPTVTLVANPTSVAYNASSTLTWTSTNAISCVASGDWSGTKLISGDEVENNLTSNKNYVITCIGAGGTASATANVTVGSPPPDSTPATLHIIKLVVNSNGGTAIASAFNLHVKLSGTDVSGSPATGTGTPGTAYTLSPATYVVSEDANSSYTGTFSGDCDASGNVTLATGDSKTCTVTNTDVPPTTPPVTPPTPSCTTCGGGPLVPPVVIPPVIIPPIVPNLPNTGIGIGIGTMPSPLIHLTEVPNPATLSVLGGLVTYTHNVTNPGTISLSNVNVVDDKCSPAQYISGDTNTDGKLDPTETWIYTCATKLTVTTTNTAVASGEANGTTVKDSALATVTIASPGFPKTGFSPFGENNPWNFAILLGDAIVVLMAFIVIFKKHYV